MRNDNVDTVLAPAATVISESIGCSSTCDRSALMQSMYAGSPSLYIRERELISTSRPKPLPPVKPATLRNRTACGNVQSFSPQTSKLDAPNSYEDAPRASTEVVHSPNIPCEERKNVEKVMSNSDNSAAKFDPLLETLTDLCIEELNDESKSCTLESVRFSNSKSTTTIKRTSFLNDEIRKPKIKPPPPPPTQSLRRSSQSEEQSSRAEIIVKKLNLDDVPDNSQDIRTDKVNGDVSAPSKPHRFERCLDSWHIPR